MMIGLGGLIYLMIGGPLGALLFSVGLLGILSQGLKLYTGMAGDEISWSLGVVLLGNIVGTGILAILTWIAFPAIPLPNLDREPLETFFKAIFCGVLMSMAVRGYRKGLVWMPLLCVPAFILAGFSHCIADSYYYIMRKDPCWLSWGLSILGNLIGCNIPYKKWIK